ncbi:hypothetical protein [Blautia marasmi]|uniref:hypothetical protein n=1 Tax=Blautia marasmi TaxID=1917868 RepID=UPI00266DD1F5|nr:hypothetical protein [Blautia marasmi]
MKGRSWRGIGVSVFVSAVLVIGNAGMAFADAEQIDQDENIGSAISQDLVEDSDGEWIFEDIDEAQDIDEADETEDGLQEETDGEKDEVNREHHHDVFCGYREAQPEIPCDYGCTDTDGDGIIDHCSECAYRPAVEAVPCKYELEKLKAEEELKKQQELEKQQENQDSEQEKMEEESGIDSPEQGGLEQKDSELDESGESKDQNIKKEDENGEEESSENQKDVPSEMTEQGQKNDTSKKEEQTHEVSTPQTEGREDASEDTNDDGKIAEDSLEDMGESIDKMKGMDDDPEEFEAEEGALPSNQPVYAVEIPSQVNLTEDTDGFTIQTKKLIPEEDGELVVTVEGTESRDRENFALYCGESSWEYRLEIAGNLITPEENRAVLDGWSEVQKLNILPEENVDLCAGEYSGVLMFHVVYESRVENYEMGFN